MSSLRLIAATGCVTLQDRGRPGWLAQGLSRGGAADPLALDEGAALLDQPGNLLALELFAARAVLETRAPLRVALTGAPMRADLHPAQGGAPQALIWHAAHALPAGARLVLSPLTGGASYLTPGGGFAAPQVMGAGSAHLAGGIGAMPGAGTDLALHPDPGGPVGRVLTPLPRFQGGTLRALPGLHAGLFTPDDLARLQQTPFTRDNHANRMGLRLVPPAGSAPFKAAGARVLVSDIVQPGDVQITGSGTPFVLGCECQTTGGYPRIATILPCDLALAVQAPPGAALRLRLVDLPEARAVMASDARARATLPTRIRPLTRDPAQAALLTHSLIGGVVDAADPDHIPEPHEAPR